MLMTSKSLYFILMAFVFGELLLNNAIHGYTHSRFPTAVSRRTLSANPSISIKQFRDQFKLANSLTTVDSKPNEDVKVAAAVNTIAKASLMTSSINLLKNCVGAGVFSLNSRVSGITSDPSHFKYVILLIFGMATWAVYNFYIVGETCKITKTSTFGEAWQKTVSAESQWIVQFVVTVAPIISCVANTIVLTDVLKLLLRVVGAPLWVYTNRPLVVSALCAVILYPICTVKDLSALKSVSVIGLAGQVSAMVALGIRLFDGSYKIGGKFYETANIGHGALAAAAAAAKGAGAAAVAASPVALSKWFVLASLLSYCFVTHYNAPRYYVELQGKEEDSLKFLKMTSLSYLSAALVYLTTVVIANKLFGPYSQSFALNSFSPKDPLALFAFLAFGTSVLASFPLIFFSTRNWFIGQATKFFPAASNVPTMTALLLGLIGGITILCNDIGKVGSLAGAIFGSSMMFIFPPIMYINALLKQDQFQQQQTSSSLSITNGLEAGVMETKATTATVKKPTLTLLLNSLSLCAGFAVAIMGTINSIRSLSSK